MGSRLVLLAFLMVACGERRPIGPADGSMDSGGDAGRDSAVLDAGSDAASDARRTDTGGIDGGVDSGGLDSGSLDSGSDSGSDAPGADGGALDPRLSPAGPEGDTCDTPGSSGECPFVQVCRFFDATTSRCESCEPCGNLNAPCSASNECDILFMCFAGRCTNICPLGTSFCGPPDDCIDVGHPTHGVCRPF